MFQAHRSHSLAKDFAWETKSISIQNSAWVGAVKKTEVAFNP